MCWRTKRAISRVVHGPQAPATPTWPRCAAHVAAPDPPPVATPATPGQVQAAVQTRRRVSGNTGNAPRVRALAHRLAAVWFAPAPGYPGSIAPSLIPCWCRSRPSQRWLNGAACLPVQTPATPWAKARSTRRPQWPSRLRKGGNGCAFESKNQTVQKRQIKDKGDRVSVLKRGLILVAEVCLRCYSIDSVKCNVFNG